MASTGWADHGGNCVGQQFIREFAAMRPADSLAKKPLPTLLIQAGKDVSVAPAQVDIYCKALEGSSVACEKALLPEADHTFNSLAFEREVIERTVKWLSKAL